MNQRAEVTNIIQQCGISANLRGYHMLRDAIDMAIQDPSLLHAVTTRIYPALAEMYDSNVRAVETALRTAIKKGSKNQTDAMKWLFGHHHPSAAEFICTIADDIHSKVVARRDSTSA